MPANIHHQPAIFLPHGGGPCFFMDWTWGPADTWNATQRFLESLAATLPESPKPCSSSAATGKSLPSPSASPPCRSSFSTTPASPRTLTNSTGRHPAIRHWPLASRTCCAMPAFPRQPIPNAATTTASSFLSKSRFQRQRFQWLLCHSTTLRSRSAHGSRPCPGPAAADEGVLIIASGMSFHNLRVPCAGGSERARAFDACLTSTVQLPAPERDASSQIGSMPIRGLSPTREEHLIPLMVAAGAGGEGPGKLIFSDEPMAAKHQRLPFR